MVELESDEEPLVHEEAMLHDDDDDTDEDYIESEDDSEEELQAEPSKKAIYNKDGLLEKLEDIAWPEKVDWMHKLTVDHDQGEKVDVNDDLTRELAFYTQALDGTRQAFEKLQSKNKCSMDSSLSQKTHFLQLVQFLLARLSLVSKTF